MGTIDVITFLLSMLYIVLAIRNSVLCFFVAIIQCLLWTYLDFFKYLLIFDGLLQIFYIVMAVWGIFLWQKKETSQKELPITYLSQSLHLWVILGGSFLALVMAYGSTFLLNAEMRYLDAFTTIFSVLATFMLVHRKIDTWIYFVISDALYVYIYLKAGSEMLALVMIIYTLMAIIGFYSWKKKIEIS